MSELTVQLVEVLIGLTAMIAGLCTVAGYPVAQYRGLRDLRGRWFLAACLPLAVMTGVVIVTVVGFAQGTTLRPMLVLVTAPAAWVWLRLLWSAHHRRVVTTT